MLPGGRGLRNHVASVSSFLQSLSHRGCCKEVQPLPNALTLPVLIANFLLTSNNLPVGSSSSVSLLKNNSFCSS